MAKSKKGARGYVALECTVCKENDRVSIENHFVQKNKNNTPERLEINKFCPTCGKHTIHKEKK